jgi:hypothetical protein
LTHPSEGNEVPKGYSLTNSPMFTNFLSLPQELRDQIYGLVLLFHEPTDPWPDSEFNPRHQITPGLFRVNKTIHHETTSLFYSKNPFDFTTTASAHVTFFLGHIGRNNADSIRHVCIDFPKLCISNGVVSLNKNSIGILAGLQRGCPNLSTLMISQVCSAMFAPLDITLAADTEIVTKALKMLNSHFRAIPSLQNIIVKFYEEGPSDHDHDHNDVK